MLAWQLALRILPLLQFHKLSGFHQAIVIKLEWGVELTL